MYLQKFQVMKYLLHLKLRNFIKRVLFDELFLFKEVNISNSIVPVQEEAVIVSRHNTYENRKSQYY